MIKVRIPTPLRPMTGGKKEVEIAGTSVEEIIDNLESTHPGIKERICDEQGEVRRFINIYVNEEDIRFLTGKETPLKDGDEMSIIPAIAGGT
jgi:molybdopterin synthase sulfur carrier subunit